MTNHKSTGWVEWTFKLLAKLQETFAILEWLQICNARII